LYISQFQSINIFKNSDWTNVFGGSRQKREKKNTTGRSATVTDAEKETGDKVVHLAICNFGRSELNRTEPFVWALEGKNLLPHVKKERKKKVPTKSP